MAQILIIEDNATNLELMSYLLRSQGHAVLPALDGEEGLAVAASEQPDIVLCDLRLPGIDGLEVVARFKNDPALRDIPVIAVTAYAMVGDRERGMAAGFDGYLEKPINPESFVHQVMAWLGTAAPVSPAIAPPAPVPPPLEPSVRIREGVPDPVAEPPLVLVVDDRALNRQFLCTLLTFAGFRVVEAADGEEGLAVARGRRPALVISDIVMPVMDGAQFAREIRRDPMLKNVPVIFYTATFRMREARQIAEDCGVPWVLSKPSEPEAILQVVLVALGLKQYPAGGRPSPAPAMVPREGPKPPELIAERLADYLSILADFNVQMQSIIRRGLDLAAESDGLRQLSVHLEQSLNSLQGLSLRLATIVELGMELSAEREPDKLVHLFCRGAQDVMSGRYAAVGLVAEDGESLGHFASRGLDEQAIEAVKAAAPQIGRALIGARALRLSGLEPGERPAGLPTSHPPIADILAVPIISSGRAFGWMYAAGRLGDGGFTDDDERLALTLGALLGSAYENACLQEETERHAAQLQIEVGERIRAQDSLRRLAHRLLSAQEEERRRIAADLHDGLQQLLAAAKINLALAVRPEDGSATNQAVAKADEIIDGAIVESRRILTGLRPHLLDQLGLVEALRHHLTTTIAADQCNGTVEAEGPLASLEPRISTALFRIVQEAVSNSIQHGRAGRVQVRLRRASDTVFLQVHDDGDGFDCAAGLADLTRPHVGLTTMRERAELLGGTFSIDSGPGGGTIVAVEIPVTS